ncbi:sensor domain-containing diguanylate cyclase [Neobacillus cucumis]|uniref:GGDEF domain-containing protein n=1 Tax=Neobacillus cucumis TaxID=1740721 RepID=A0A2N5HMG4_9BACI|nr:sensor domain-containing diguanylate cyclase [Neobacillus cucumis]PLS06668.1 GGDEF domain-containing protein [Neobacillus cucumis]
MQNVFSKGDLLLDAEKYKKLFQISEKFYSTLEVDNLLAEIFITLKEIYPSYSYYLLLSLDSYNHNDLPIIDLEYDSENMMVINAYESGQIQFESSEVSNHAILYAPLKGKSAIYGVMQVIVPEVTEFPAVEAEFIGLLSNSAGAALENAKIHQQAQRTISDLQLINKTSHQLNSNQPLVETLTFMSGQIKDSFEAQEVGFFLFSKDQLKAKVIPGSTSFFYTQQARIYIDYIKGKFQQSNEPLFIGDLEIPKQPHTVFHSIMAVPVVISKKLKGFSIIMHQDPYFFPFEAFKLLQSLVHHSSLALTNALLRDELEKLVITDHLTKLHSRKFLDEKIQQSMNIDQEGTFILIDIDNFKEINDTYGHQIGDMILVQVANLIKGSIRESDIGARWGGEELAIYLPRVPLETGVAIAQRILNKVSECSDPHITVSCGVSCWKKEWNDTYQYLFKRADEALYRAKETGKNKVVIQEDTSLASYQNII